MAADGGENANGQSQPGADGWPVTACDFAIFNQLQDLGANHGAFFSGPGVACQEMLVELDQGAAVSIFQEIDHQCRAPCRSIHRIAFAAAGVASHVVVAWLPFIVAAQPSNTCWLQRGPGTVTCLRTCGPGCGRSTVGIG